MPRLIVLNGPPGIGKSTLARRYVEDQPLALCLEQDVVRRMVGGWLSRETDSGLLARELCLSMAGTHLLQNRDVIVPQFVANPGYLDQLAHVARAVGATHVECLLIDDPDSSERRFHARIDDPVWAEHQRIAARFIEEAGGYRAEYERMIDGVAGRDVVRIPSLDGDVLDTYATLLEVLGMRSEDAVAVVLREVTPDNVRAVCDLRVAPKQERFVTSAAVSLAEAYAHPQAWCRAVCSPGGEVVGFVMLHDTLDEPGYMLWRLLVGERHQRRGYGRAVVKHVVDYVRTRPGAVTLKVGARRGEGSPRPFYESLGFVATGQVIDGDEDVLSLDLGVAGP